MAAVCHTTTGSLSSHPGASKTEYCAAKEKQTLSQPKPGQEGGQILVIFWGWGGYFV